MYVAGSWYIAVGRCPSNRRWKCPAALEGVIAFLLVNEHLDERALSGPSLANE